MFVLKTLDSVTRFSAKLLVVAFVSATCLLNGCGGGDSQTTVTGKVTFEGAPVTSGVITFENPETGFANQVDLQAEGTYSIELPDGDYVVAIEPPMKATDAGPDTEPDMDYAKVDNIPELYRNSGSSGFTAQVSSSQTEFDFGMTQQP